MLGAVARGPGALSDITAQAKATERHPAEFLAFQQGDEEPSIMCQMNRSAFERARLRLTVARVVDHLKPTFQQRPVDLRGAYEASVDHPYWTQGGQLPPMGHWNSLVVVPFLRYNQRIAGKFLEQAGDRARDDHVGVEPNRLRPAGVQLLEQQPGLYVPAGHSVWRPCGEDNLGLAFRPGSDRSRCFGYGQMQRDL